MKKIIFLIAAILFSLNTFAQQVALTDAISIDIPMGAQKITKEQVIAYVIKKFNPEKLILDNYTDLPARHSYKIDDVLVLLNPFDSTKVELRKGYMLSLKKGLDEMNHGNSTYTSSFKKVNNNSVVIINYIAGNIEYYHFYCRNVNNARALNGTIQFDQADKDKATAILEHILNSIKFKD